MYFRYYYFIGFVNTLLSWKALIPLSRLTYCAYLVHPTVTYTYVLSKRSLVYFTDLEQVRLYVIHLGINYVPTQKIANFKISMNVV